MIHINKYIFNPWHNEHLNSIPRSHAISTKVYNYSSFNLQVLVL